MTQTKPLDNGTKVLYAVFYGNGEISHNLDHEATIQGFTHLEGDSLHYVLEGYSEGGEKMLFIRPHSQVKVDTTLSQYIGDYIEEEFKRTGHWQSYKRWIVEAIDAYEGGAR